jgi:hypothetical protein
MKYRTFDAFSSTTPYPSPSVKVLMLEQPWSGLFDIQLGSRLRGKLVHELVFLVHNLIILMLASAYFLYLYDSVLTFPEEYQYVWKSRMSLGKVCHTPSGSSQNLL